MTATYFAVEFGSMKPTTSFAKAQAKAEAEADRRQAPVRIYENGSTCMIVHPAVRNARHDFYTA